ncbi:MAG: hypothetical protein LBV13_03465 [Methanomassiliicoccaceae archaeon]|jgi:DNA-binding response OmpR family regulator|nr:hypothetical protein [Methanomassiliicoccaceae archaeon]
MKVLIVDGNTEISGILSDMLSMSNRTVRTADTPDEALSCFHEFRPDAVFVNITADREGTTGFLRSISGDAKGRTKIFVIADDEKDMTPDMHKDGWIRRPFSSTDIMDIINAAGKENEKKKSFLKNMLGNISISRNRKNISEGNSMHLRFGRSYLFMEDEPTALNAACRYFADDGDDILYITSSNVKAVKEAIRCGTMSVRAISDKEGKDLMNGAKIGSVADEILRFIHSAKRPVAVIDDLRAFMVLNETDAVITMMDQVIKNSGKEMTMLASIAPDNITERDKGLLLNDMTEYRTGGIT